MVSQGSIPCLQATKQIRLSFKVLLMRTIENKICALISSGLQGQAFDRKLTKRDQVVSDGQGKVEIFLWGTRVATVDGKARKITVQNGGYQTVTTKSRLNSILWGVTADKPRIYQHKYVWFINVRDPLTNDLISKEFSSGMSFDLR